MVSRSLVTYLATLLLIPPLIASSEGLSSTAGKILQLGVDSQAIAMGEAYTAVANDGSAIYWNPAGLAQVDQYELMYNQNLWIGDSQDSFLVYAQPFYDGGLGVGLKIFNFGKIEKFGIDPEGLPIPTNETYSPFATVISLGYGFNLNNFGNIGGSLKLVSENIDTSSSMTMLIDIGAQIQNVVKDLDVAIMIQNAGLAIEGYSAPLNVRLGAAYKLPYLIDKGLDQFLISLDGRMPLPFDDSYSINVGMEYNYHDLIFARVGYKLSTINQLGGTAGLTTGIGLRIADYALDYALSPMGEFGLAHQITLSAGFAFTKSDSSSKRSFAKRHQPLDYSKRTSALAKGSDDDSTISQLSSLSNIKLRKADDTTSTAVKEKVNKKKRRVRLPAIYFEQSSASLNKAAINQLIEIAAILHKEPYHKLLISGHADNSIEKHEAFLLSKERIDRVIRYLTSMQKVSLKNISTRSFGNKKPVASNRTEAGSTKNRRVEITILYLSGVSQ